MTKRISNIIMAVVCIIVCFTFRMPVYASDGQEYITISVDAVDENGNLQYALDSDDPSAFTDSNEFVVPAGTSHTIYVKDAAGNISSQTYSAEEDSDENQYVLNGETDEGGQRININLELGDTQEQEDYEIAGDPAEPGSASVTSKIITDGSDSAEKVFYTFTTKEGETLYLVIDQGQGTDNVYLLDTVSLGDLKVLADGQNGAADEREEDNLLSALTASSTAAEADDIITNEQSEKKSRRTPLNSNAIIVLIFAVVGGGAYYYLKVYRNKKDEVMDAMDAMDMDEFEPEGEEEELEFDYDDAEKEKYLDELIDEDESLYDANPDEYAMSHIDDGDYDAGIEPDEFEPEYEEDDGLEG